jgi:hypothetical protein
MKQKLLILLSILLSGLVAQGQGLTTSSMNGRVNDSAGEPLPGATIVAIHNPTGTQFGNITNADGFFRIPNMTVGGPYTITISFVGYQDFVKQNIYLTLGQTFKLDANMQEQVTELEGIDIIANRNDIFDGNRTGAQTMVGLETIENTPTLGRTIGDFARFLPQARIEEGFDGFEISIAGINNRYNSIYIDGAVSNDVFGLSASGTNGGQTGVSPYPIDAIEQFNIVIAPFDVRQSGFAGGSVNAITRSGTNSVQGSAYWYSRNERMAGKTPAEDFSGGITRDRLPEFSSNIYGVRVGAPIIKDKLFFFLNAEVQRQETPQPYDFNTYIGTATSGDVQNVISVLNGYGYDPGTFDNNTSFLNSEKIIGKFDFNLGKNHKLSLRHSYVNAENLEARSSSTSSIQFENGSEYFVSTTNSTALEVKSNFDHSSNQFTLGGTFVRDDRDPFGDPFPSVTVRDGSGRFIIGAEPFSTANLLNQDAITINNNFEIYRGRHTFLIGANAEFYKAKNLFIAFNYGNYTWNDLPSFLAGNPANSYNRTYSQVDNISGDESKSGVVFNSALYALYLQDEMQVSDNLRMTLGLRMDLQTFEDTPENADFNTTALPLIEQYYDTHGATTGSFIDPKAYFSPRLGFNYDITGNQNSQVRGGIGLFTSRVPLVWPGGAYNNNGANLGGVGTSNEPFVADVNQQNPTTFDPNNLQYGGDVDLYANDFKIPRVLKMNLGMDQKLPGGIVGTFDFIYSKWINDIFYQNINLLPPNQALDLTGTPDTRDRYTSGTAGRIDPGYGRVILATNVSKGYSYNVSLGLTKTFDFGLGASASYSYGDAYNVFEGTSSQNSSQWRYRQTISSRNTNQDIGRSIFAPGHRILTMLSYRKEYAKFLGTGINLIWEGRTGNYFSYIIGNSNGMTGVDSGTPELAYIPGNNSEINMSAADYAILNALIENDKYLREHRGEYAERNMSAHRFESILDLRLTQDFFIEMNSGKRNVLQFSLDIFNLGNLLNKEWGKMYQREDDRFNYALYNFAGFAADGTTPTFTAVQYNDNQAYNGNLDDSGLRSSRWQMQFGLRYIFQ